MSRGPGRTQQRILDHLDEVGRATVADLASAAGVSPTQTRRAVHSLADRGLLVVTRESIGWKGVGEYGSPRITAPGQREPRGVPVSGLVVWSLAARAEFESLVASVVEGLPRE